LKLHSLHNANPDNQLAAAAASLWKQCENWPEGKQLSMPGINENL
jgi:hypothetical protein